jgi:hypothetical protein
VRLHETPLAAGIPTKLHDNYCKREVIGSSALEQELPLTLTVDGVTQG